MKGSVYPTIVAAAVMLWTAPLRAGESPKEPPPVSVESPATVPQMACEQPKIPQRYSMPHEDVDYFIKRASAYVECVAKYISERQAQIRKYNDLARAQADAGNAAVKEVNDYRAKVKAFQKKQRGSSDSSDAQDGNG
jgi:hypothetical protein